MGGSQEPSTPNPRVEHRLAHEVHRGTSPENNENVYGENQCEGLNSQSPLNVSPQGTHSHNTIKVHVTYKRENRNHQVPINVLPQETNLSKNLKVIKRSNKAVQALNLPTVVNINPRSLNNKLESFKTFLEEEQVDLACVSESHECEGRPLVESLKLDNYEIISSMHQRRGKGGRPALIVNKLKYDVTNITNTLVSVSHT